MGKRKKKTLQKKKKKKKIEWDGNTSHADQGIKSLNFSLISV
jgi:hypothetical protein